MLVKYTDLYGNVTMLTLSGQIESILDSLVLYLRLDLVNSKLRWRYEDDSLNVWSE